MRCIAVCGRENRCGERGELDLPNSPLAKRAVIKWRPKDERTSRSFSHCPRITTRPKERGKNEEKISSYPEHSRRAVCKVFGETFIGAAGLYPIASIFAAAAGRAWRPNPRGATGLTDWFIDRPTSTIGAGGRFSFRS